MIELHHRIDGPADAPLLILGPAMGTTLELWAPQLPALTRSWRVLRYDIPGHGGTAPVPGVTVQDLAGEVLALADAQGAWRVAYGGVSVGGAIGTILAADEPDRVGGLILCCTSAWFGPTKGWFERAALARRRGMEPIAAVNAGRWFTPGFSGAAPYLAMLRSADPAGYAAMCEAIGHFDARDRLGLITAPTLIIAGAQDPATPPSCAELLARGISGAELLVVDGAAHLANVERPEVITEAVVRHLDFARNAA